MTECVLLTAWQMRARLACYLSGHVRKSGHRCLARHRTEVCRGLLVRNDVSAHSLHLDAARCELSGAEHTVKSEFARSAGSLSDLKIASRLATLLLLHFLNPGIEASTHSRTAATRAIAAIKLLMFEVFAALPTSLNEIGCQVIRRLNGFYMHVAADRFLGNATADHRVGTEQFCMRFGQPKKIEVGDFEHLERKQVCTEPML